MPYKNVTAHEWERTALYFAVGMLLIVTAANSAERNLRYRV